MKCFNHSQADAIAVCVNCGKALCSACILKSAGGKLVCSQPCSESITAADLTVSYLRDRTAKGWSLLAYALLFPVSFVFLLVALFSAWEEEWFLAFFLAPIVLILTLAGFWCRNLGKKMTSHNLRSSS